MKAIDPTRGLYSGRMGDIIFYVMNGKTYARHAPDPGKRKPLTEKQRGMNVRFRAVQWMYRVFRAEVSPEIWRAAGREAGKTASNLFHSTNCACFDAEGRLADPEGFQFSAGSLLLPRDIAVEAAEGGRFRVTWTEERELTTACGDDLLRVGVIPETDALTALPAEAVSGRRADGTGVFALPEICAGTVCHAYVYFERADGTAWSPSRHFRLEQG